MGLLCLRSRSKLRFKMSIDVCPDDIFWITEHFVPNLVWLCSIMSQSVMRKHCCLWGQGHSKGSYDQNMTLSTIFSELLFTWQQKLVWWCISSNQSVLWRKKNRLLHSGSKSQRRVKMLIFVQMISFKLPNSLFPNLVLWCFIIQELIWSKYDKFYCIFWIDDFFSTKLGLIKHYHKPECYMEKLDCCVQGQGHSNTSKYQWMFIQMMFSESLNLLLPNLVWWCSIMSQSVMRDCLLLLSLPSRSRSQRGSKCQWMFVRTLSYEPQNILLPNLVW